MKKIKCLRCKNKPRLSPHLNTKYCKQCRDELLKRPAATLTPQQERIVRKFAGKIYKKDVCKKAEISWSRITRWARDNNVSLNALQYKPEVVHEVITFYKIHGKIKTQAQFPNIKVRSIVEKYAKGESPRQKRWTDSQLLELVRMAGIISKTDQAKYFNRPGAHKGSIVSVWMKRFGIGAGNINGMSAHRAKYFVTDNCPTINTKVWSGRKSSGTQFSRTLYLWTDMEKHLLPDCPAFVKEAIVSMAKFQRWVFRTNNVRTAILRIIRERELK